MGHTRRQRERLESGGATTLSGAFRAIRRSPERQNGADRMEWNARYATEERRGGVQKTEAAGVAVECCAAQRSAHLFAAGVQETAAREGAARGPSAPPGHGVQEGVGEGRFAY